MTERTSPVTGDPSMVTVAFGRDVDDSGSVTRLLNRSSRTSACFTIVTFSERTLHGYGSQMNTAPERFVRQSIDFAAGATIQTRTEYVA
jgi:hypothetical protein